MQNANKILLNGFNNEWYFLSGKPIVLFDILVKEKDNKGVILLERLYYVSTLHVNLFEQETEKSTESKQNIEAAEIKVNGHSEAGEKQAIEVCTEIMSEQKNLKEHMPNGTSAKPNGVSIALSDHREESDTNSTPSGGDSSAHTELKAKSLDQSDCIKSLQNSEEEGKSQCLASDEILSQRSEVILDSIKSVGKCLESECFVKPAPHLYKIELFNEPKETIIKTLARMADLKIIAANEWERLEKSLNGSDT